MELRDLSYFCKLVENKSYLKTASYFHISQPAISAMVKRLQRELNCTLISKNHSNPKLTLAGATLYKEAIKIIKLEKQAKEDVKHANDANFRIGYSELASRTWLAAVLKKFYTNDLLKYVSTKQYSSPILIKKIVDGQLDAIIFSELFDEPLAENITSTFLKTFELNYCVSKTSALAKLHFIDFKSIQNDRLITYDRHFLGREALRITAAKAGCILKDKNLIVVDSMDTIAELTKSGIGIGVLTNYGKDFSELKSISPIPEQQVKVALKLGVRNDLLPNKIQQECLNTLKSLF